ncbi:hypothetical protein RDV84_11675 [Lysobacter yananisis]|uniref:Sigma-70 family RNA polymerase sigma factor n=1 Tax=Lysobacter yananisis TaxID=1003114 RepID=A0ABY9PGW5_9GAMM|nr:MULTISPECIES: hypothetical protein [Lysobacter]WMT05471.1 hypothetical protein RDV84_11675 [Lysobacter yananisis]
MDEFDRFICEHHKDLRRIASHTLREHSYHDVVNEAWVMANTMATRLRLPIDFGDPEFRNLLLSHLYQHLVRYTDVNVRRAIRLDHACRDDDSSGAAHPLLNSLASDDGHDPLSLLLAVEAKPLPPSEANEQHSLASAYLTLLDHFGNRMRHVARHLLISLSYAYRRCAHARQVTARQHALLLAPPAPASSLRAWRRARAARMPRQLEFDFEEKLWPCAGQEPQ